MMANKANSKTSSDNRQCFMEANTNQFRNYSLDCPLSIEGYGRQERQWCNRLVSPSIDLLASDGLLRYFVIEKLTDERDYYGVHKRKLGPLRRKQGHRAST